MNVIKIIDTFLFGTEEEQRHYNKVEKLWYYLPIFFIIFIWVYVQLVCLF